VLTVGINLHHRLVAVPLGVKEGGAHGTADSDVKREGNHGRTRLLSERGGVISRTVVDHEDVRLRPVLTNFCDDVGYRPALIPRRDSDELAAGWHSLTIFHDRWGSPGTR
jgi:hypothetical protein